MSWRGDVEATVARGGRLEPPDIDVVLALFANPIGRFPTGVVRVTVEGAIDSDPDVVSEFEKRIGDSIRALGKTPSFYIS
jgi:hypothetical protein